MHGHLNVRFTIDLHLLTVIKTNYVNSLITPALLDVSGIWMDGATHPWPLARYDTNLRRQTVQNHCCKRRVSLRILHAVLIRKSESFLSHIIQNCRNVSKCSFKPKSENVL